MKVTIVHVHVKPECVDAFIRATEHNHLNSILESGNLRFDILQDPCDLTHFVLYEAYDTEESSAAHKLTSHYLEWRDQVAEMMSTPRQGIPMKGLFPSV